MTPATARRAALTSRVMVSFIGQPATVSSTVRRTRPPSISTASTMPRSVIGRLISGSMTRVRAASTASLVGSARAGQGSAHGGASLGGAPWRSAPGAPGERGARSRRSLHSRQNKVFSSYGAEEEPGFIVRRPGGRRHRGRGGLARPRGPTRPPRPAGRSAGRAGGAAAGRGTRRRGAAGRVAAPGHRGRRVPRHLHHARRRPARDPMAADLAAPRRRRPPRRRLGARAGARGRAPRRGRPRLVGGARGRGVGGGGRPAVGPPAAADGVRARRRLSRGRTRRP